VSAGLTLSGAIALGSIDSQRGEVVGRGLLMGLSAVSTPIVAITAGVSRESRRDGSLPLRSLGWTTYPGVMLSEGLMFYQALHDRQASLGVSIGVAGLSACSVLAHAFDAFLVSRKARVTGFALQLSPRGGRLGFHF
jgi:hypothetical protein